MLFAAAMVAAGLGAVGPTSAQEQTDRTSTPTGTLTSITGTRLFNIESVNASQGICAGTAPTFSATITPASGFTPNPDLTLTNIPTVAFWATGSSCFTTIPDSNNARFIGEGSVAIADLNQLFFPEDFGGAFDATDFLAQIPPSSSDPCDGGAVEVERLLCLVANLNDNNTADAPSSTSGTVDPITGEIINSTGDLVAWTNFRLDTVAPPQPTIEVTSLDSALAVSVSLPQNISDMNSYSARVREQVADGLTDCTEWPQSQLIVSFDRKAQGSASFEFPVTGLTNSIPYEVCVRVEDEALNPSPFSEVASGTPIDECDFVECFPGGAPGGYCGATGAGVLWPLTLLGLVWRVRRRGQSSALASSRGDVP